MSTLAEVIQRDTRANQPAANSVPAGTLYYVTDENVTERSDGSSWEDVSDAGSGSGIPPSTVNAKGDLIVGTADDTVDRLAVGSGVRHLIPDSGETTGLRWGLLDKLDATEAPDADNDVDEGYEVGSRWIDVTNDKVYTCVDATDGAAVWKEGFSSAGGAPGAATISGGTETSAGGFDYHAFTSNGDLTVSADGLVDVLVVGGGGGGGNHSGGGGGGGDVVFVEQIYLEAGTYAAVIGTGGAGSPASFSNPAAGNGEPSSFAGIYAAGGGAGGHAVTSDVDAVDEGQKTGRDGAAGGGGCLRQTTPGGRGVGMGGNGGAARTGNTAGTGAGGGGGGAGGAGGAPGGTNVGGTGGAGRDMSTNFGSFGASGLFGGGGGGGAVNTGTGGSGTNGGGNGGAGATGSNATANTGGGGGGGGNNGTTPFAGGNGAAGIVIVRVPS